MNYYDILGIKKDASLENIQKAKDKLKFGGPDDKAPFSMWAKIDEAYEVLSDREKRREYDRKLEEETIDYSTSKLQSEFASLQSMIKENKEKIVETEVKDDQLSKTSLMSAQSENELSKEKNDHEQLEKIKLEENQSVQTDLTNTQSEEVTDMIDYNNQILTSNSKSQYVIDQLSKKAEETFTVANLKRFGKNIVLAIPTAVLATGIIIKELSKKNNYSLQEDSAEKTITEIKTPEMELEEEYRKKLSEKIEKKLNEYHTNYDLQIDKLRYENYIELLQKKIELKEQESVKKGKITIYKLQLTALKRQLEVFREELDKVNSKIQQKQKHQNLSRLYRSLNLVNKKIAKNTQSDIKKTIAIKNLQVKKDKLTDKLKLEIDKVKSKRSYYAIFKDSLISAHAISENFVDNVFVPADEIDNKMAKSR